MFSDPSERSRMKTRPHYIEIFLVSVAALLLEISYTRIISFKLYYYYVYLVIGLALVGLGSGAVFVAISKRLRETSLDRIIVYGCLAGAGSIGVGYYVASLVKLNTAEIWDYGSRASFSNVARLALICFALYVSFVAIGVMLASILGRAGERIGRLYFADLLGAGVACAIVVFVLRWIGPPAVVALSALLLAATGLWVSFTRPDATAMRPGRLNTTRAVGLVVGALAFVGVVASGLLPEPVVEDLKSYDRSADVAATRWDPVFRVDAINALPGVKFLYHDGLFGSGIYEFDGDVEGLTRFDTDLRSFPFEVLGEPPRDQLIIGSAGGHEILASLYYGSEHVDAVELNPGTVDLLTGELADYSGNIVDYPQVDLTNADGRTFLARKDDDHLYDLIWFVAPDSYSASNAASAGAFVLSESYLYTEEMVVESLEHLSDDGVIAVQFGEFVFDEKPNRTARYVSTVREALEEIGVDDHASHILIATSLFDHVPVSTILVKRTPFTDDEIDAFVANAEVVDGSNLQHIPGRTVADTAVNRVIDLEGDELEAFYESYDYDITSISDNRPFFWHFTPFPDVIANLFEPLDGRDLEDSLGERVLLLLVAMSVVFAVVFLLVPFVAVRSLWRELPFKGLSAVYFATLGLGFMFFEITMIQKLTLFLGYPTYSLTVTLASILIFTGIGSLLSDRYRGRERRATLGLFLVLGVLTVFYLFGLETLTEGLLGLPLLARVLIAFAVLAPLGLCLGAFMPLGLGVVARSSPHEQTYVAWGWAVNGFFSVVGSTTTTIMSMAFGFETVLLVALAIYGLAVLLFGRIINLSLSRN